MDCCSWQTHLLCTVVRLLLDAARKRKWFIPVLDMNITHQFICWIFYSHTNRMGRTSSSLPRPLSRQPGTIKDLMDSRIAWARLVPPQLLCWYNWPWSSGDKKTLEHMRSLHEAYGWEKVADGWVRMLSDGWQGCWPDTLRWLMFQKKQ